MTSQSRGAWQESSVAKFGAVHKKLKEEGKDETTRGASLRELQRFFKEHDKDEGYAGLHRISDEDGTAVWTILDEKEVTTKLEERTKQRKQEERRHDDLFGAQYAQLRAPSETTGAASMATGTKAEAAEAERVRVVADAGEKAAEEKAAVSPAAVATTKGVGNGGDDGKNSESNNSTSRPALMTVGDHGCGVVCGLQ